MHKYFVFNIGVELAACLSMVSQLRGKDWNKREVIVEAVLNYEAKRRGRVAVLQAISDLSQTLGQVSSENVILARDSLLLATPSFVKGPVFDFMMRLSLATSPSIGAFVRGSSAYMPPPLPRPSSN